MVVLDDDVVSCVDCTDKNCKVHVHKITNWLMHEFAKAIAAANDVLLTKSKCTPHVLWMAPPTHKYFGDYNNDQRAIQTECFQEIVQTRPDMSVLKLVKIWDPDNTNFFLYEAYRFTSTGLDAYWASIDAVVKFWFDVISKKIDNKKLKTRLHRRQTFQGNRHHTNNKKFHWKNKFTTGYQHQPRRHMPTPP